MSEPAITISPEATAKEATRLMLEHKIGCLPVVEGHPRWHRDGDGHLALCRELIRDRAIAPVGGREAMSIETGRIGGWLHQAPMSISCCIESQLICPRAPVRRQQWCRRPSTLSPCVPPTFFCSRGQSW